MESRLVNNCPAEANSVGENPSIQFQFDALKANPDQSAFIVFEEETMPYKVSVFLLGFHTPVASW